MNGSVGWVREVFASIQGEGIYCGQRQTFVRFAGCNLRCEYCDTPAALDPMPASCGVEQFAGCGIFQQTPNPVSADRIVSACADLDSRVVALTGGEPLAQPAFAREVLRELNGSGFRAYLETNGTLPGALEQVVDLCDVIAMDIKLPSVSGHAYWAEHDSFLRVAERARVFVKVAVSQDTNDDEVRQAAGIAARGDDVPMVIQPVSGVRAPLGPDLIHMQEVALESVSDVRVIPQCHLILGVL